MDAYPAQSLRNTALDERATFRHHEFMNPYLICYRGVAHTWMCDHLGHMNTRHYTAAFDDSMQHFFSMLGYKHEPGFGWADVKHNVEYMAEIPPASLFHVECAIIRIGRKSITYQQRLLLTETGTVAAINTATSVLFDLTARHAVDAPSILQQTAPAHTIITPTSS